MFPDTPQDATVDPSPTNDTPLDATQPESQAVDSSSTESTQDSSSQQQDANQGAAAPATGLPPKDNLYGEFRRKMFEEIAPLIQGAVRDSMLGLQQSQAQTQAVSEVKYQGKYGKADLENVLRHPNATEEDKFFATRGLAYIEAREDTLRDLDTRNEKAQSQSRDAQALQGIVTDYPNLFNRASGQWNFADPLWQKAMQVYNSDARLQAHKNEGLRIAIDRAYAQMAREGQVVIQKKTVQLNSKQRQLDKNQSQALQSGGLSPVKQQGTDKLSQAKLMEAYKQNPGDASIRTAALKQFIPKNWLEQG